MASALNLVFFCFISSLLILPSTSAPSGEKAPPGCPPGWTQFGSRCFIFYHTHRTWIDAEHFCISIGGNLASIHSADENIFLSNLIMRVTGKPIHTWSGGFDGLEEKRWMWSDGSKFDVTYWAHTQPDNHKGLEHCLVLNWAEKHWNDIACHNRFPFVCARRM